MFVIDFDDYFLRMFLVFCSKVLESGKLLISYQLWQKSDESLKILIVSFVGLFVTFDRKIYSQTLKFTYTIINAALLESLILYRPPYEIFLA